METTTVKTVFQFRRATTDEWEIVNPILREGEPAYDITAKKHKIGDGKSKWNELPYAEGSGGISGDINWEQIVNAPTKLSQFENDLDIPDSSYIDTKLEQKADKDHNHDGVYQPVGDYLTEETDPTVPAWAKQAEKPMYTYEEIQNTPDLSGCATTDYVDSEIEKVKSGIEKYDDTDVKNRISANEKSIEALSGNGEGSVKETVANAIAEVVNGAPEDFDTLKEVADWITTHKTDAASMNSQINTNKDDIAALKTKVGETSVADQIAAALKDGESDKYALADDLSMANGKITALQGLVGETAVATQISDAIDGALKVDGAEKYALASHIHEIANVTGLQAILDGKAAASDVEALQSTVDGLEAKAHEHANKTVLDAITEDKVSAWDAAQANVIESIKLNGAAIAPAADKSVNIAIPAATAEALGLVKVDGESIVATDGVISVNAISTDKLVQGSDTLIMDGGNA